MLARAYSVKIGIIFGVRFQRQKVNKKANLHENWNMQTILETFEYFCQISSKSITIILSYTVSKLAHFLRHGVHLAEAAEGVHRTLAQKCHKARLRDVVRMQTVEELNTNYV